MNDTLLFAVADKIEAEPDRYDQADYFTLGACGTAYCVAGWVIALGRPDLLEPDGSIKNLRQGRWGEIAADTLDLPRINAALLFYGDARPLQGLTVPEALRQMAREKRFIPEIWGPLEDVSDSTIDPASTTGLGSVATAR